MRRLLLWLTARLPVKPIARPGEPHFVEWYHVVTVLGLFRVQIHRFVASDPDGLHDHPWGWSRSVILAGGYAEERRDRKRARKPGHTYAMTGDTFHRVVLPAGGECWTLFIHGPYVKQWGFLTPITSGATWRGRRRSEWRYEARPRERFAFDPWPWEPNTPRGRDIRRETFTSETR